MSHDPAQGQKEDFSKQSRQIWMVGGALWLGAAISFGLYHLTSSTTSHIVFGLLIAGIQVSLQLMVFMHLKKDGAGLISKVLVFTVVFTIAMIFLTLLGHANPLLSPYISR